MQKISLFRVVPLLVAVALGACAQAPKVATPDIEIAEHIPPEAAARVLAEIAADSAEFLGHYAQVPGAEFMARAPGCLFTEHTYSPGGQGRDRSYGSSYLHFVDDPTGIWRWAYLSPSPTKIPQQGGFSDAARYETTFALMRTEQACLLSLRPYQMGAVARQTPESQQQWANRIATAWVSLGGRLGAR